MIESFTIDTTQTTPVQATEPPKQKRQRRKSQQVSAGATSTLRDALQQNQPGGWSSDHRRESESYVGWNYVAIRAIALQGLQALVNCYAADKGAKLTSRAKSAYNEQDDKGEPLPQDHGLVKLYKRPNPTQTGGMFLYRRLQQLNITGKALVWNLPNRFGKTVERYVIPTALAEPHPATREYPNGYWKVTPDAMAFGGDATSFMIGGYLRLMGGNIPAEQMQVTLWPHPTRLDDGQSPIAAGSLWIDTGNMVDQARYSQLKDGPNPKLVVNAPDDFDGDASDLQRAEDTFNKKNSGAAKSRKAIFVSAGKIDQWGQTAVEMDYGGGFQQYRDAELALHGVPGVAAGITDGGSYAAFYASILQFVTITVQPQLSMFAEEDTLVIAPQFGEGITIEILAKSIDDPSVQENQLRTDLTGRIRTRNEIRALRGLEPIEGPMGEELVGGSSLGQGGMGMGQDGAGLGTESTTGLPSVPRISIGGGLGAGMGGGMGTQANSQMQPGPGGEVGLNGAQITAAKDVLLGVSKGEVSELTGTELLVSVGIPREKASAMVGDQLTIKVTEQPKPGPFGQQSFGGPPQGEPDVEVVGGPQDEEPDGEQEDGEKPKGGMPKLPFAKSNRLERYATNRHSNGVAYP